MPPMAGTTPTVIRQCVPRTARPSVSVTSTPPPSRWTAAARDRLSTVIPRRLNTSSTTTAASASSCGSTRSREEISVTCEPSAWYALANSAPVTPEPTTISSGGSSSRSYSCRQVKIRSPSGSAPGMTRGSPPAEISTTSALISWSPTATTWVPPAAPGPSSRPRPRTTLTPSAASRAETSSDCAWASAFTRW